MFGTISFSSFLLPHFLSYLFPFLPFALSSFASMLIIMFSSLLLALDLGHKFMFNFKMSGQKHIFFSHFWNNMWRNYLLLERSANLAGSVAFSPFFFHFIVKAFPFFFFSPFYLILPGHFFLCYWSGQKVCLGFSVTSYRKIERNFWPTQYSKCVIINHLLLLIFHAKME